MTTEEQRLYRQTESGIAALKRYSDSQKARQAAQRYRESGKGKVARQRYRDSAKGKLKEVEYRTNNLEYHRQYGVDSRAVVKAQCIEYLGGKCVDCGLKDDCVVVYDFHHRGAKEFNISHAIGHHLSLDELKEELDKCDLLCAICHRKRHTKFKCCQRNLLTN